MTTAIEPAIAVRHGWRAVQGPQAAILDHIGQSAVGLAIWRRTLPDELAGWLDRLPARQLPDGRVLVAPVKLRSALASLVAAANTPDGPPLRMLTDDICMLVRRFATLTGTDLVDVRLEAVEHDACWKFHRDLVPLRLLCTYRGPGTQWVPLQSAAAALNAQTAYRGPLHTLPRHAVALFRGAAEAEAAGVVHRSPPIQGRATTRLVLCLNGPSRASPPRWAAG